MQLVIDTDLHIAIQSVGVRAPVSPIGFKNQDTPALNVYFTSQGQVLDLDESPVLKFGLVVGSAPATLLVEDILFSRTLDVTGVVNYQGFPEFNTAELLLALNASATPGVLNCIGEIRYQLADGEIVHTLDIPFVIYRTILTESGEPPPVVLATYPDVSVIEQKPNKDQPSGYAALNSGGKLTPSVIPSTVQLVALKDEPLGYPGLDATGFIPVGAIPIDATLVVLAGKLSVSPTALNLTDFETTTGVSIINAAGGIFNRLLAGTGISFDLTVPGVIAIVATASGVATLIDAETTLGATLISAATGVLKRLVAGTAITFDTTTTPGAIIINSSGGSSALSDAAGTPGDTVSLINNTSGILRKLRPGSVITITPTSGTYLQFEVSAVASLIDNFLFDGSPAGGVSLVYNPSGTLKYLKSGSGITFDTSTPGVVIINSTGGGGGTIMILTDAETTSGVTLITDGIAGTLKRLIQGTGITFDTTTTPGGIIISSAGGGAGAAVVVRVYGSATASQGYPGDLTPYSFTTMVEDSSSFWNSSTPTYLTIPSNGLYLISGRAVYAYGGSPAIGMLLLGVGVNIFTTFALGSLAVILNTSSNPSLPIAQFSGVLRCLAGDKIYMMSQMQYGSVPANLYNFSPTDSPPASAPVPSPMLSILKVG